MTKEELTIAYANNLRETKAYLDFVAKTYEPSEKVKSCLFTMLELYRLMAQKTVEKHEK